MKLSICCLHKQIQVNVCFTTLTAESVEMIQTVVVQREPSDQLALIHSAAASEQLQCFKLSPSNNFSLSTFAWCADGSMTQTASLAWPACCTEFTWECNTTASCTLSMDVSCTVKHTVTSLNWSQLVWTGLNWRSGRISYWAWCLTQIMRIWGISGLFAEVHCSRCDAWLWQLICYSSCWGSTTLTNHRRRQRLKSVFMCNQPIRAQIIIL